MTTITPAQTLECEFPQASHRNAESEPIASAMDATHFEQLTTLEIIELVLKNPARLNRIIRDAALQPALIPRFLTIELVAFSIFGMTLAVVLSMIGKWPLLTAAEKYLAAGNLPLMEFVTVPPREIWSGGMAPILIAAYDIGLIAAVGICLPSLYFYGLLAGVRMSMLDVTIHAIKSQMAMAVALIGILPMYVALGLGIKVLEFDALIPGVIVVGLILPFIAGLRGTHSLYTGFMELADTLPPERRCRRECFLRRLLVSWAVCWTAVTPVMIYTLWTHMAG